MKALVAIDGSGPSQHALHYISTLLSAKTDDIILYYSPPKISLSGNTSEIAADIPDLARESLAQAVLERAQASLPPELQEITRTLVGELKPSKGILAAAEQERVDLVVVGAHAAPKRSQFFVGGTARYVAHHSVVPVLIVRGDTLPSEGHTRILVACDTDGEWRSTANVVREFNWPEKTECTVLHVVDGISPAEYETLLGSMPDRRSQMTREYIASLEQRKEACLSKLGDELGELPGVLRSATTKAVQGHVVECLVEEAETAAADMIVVSARKMTAFGRFLGSTTEGLLAHCPCSILICHQHEKP